ncbi:MAG TPA: folate-binding protein [Dongiaceae bacterium]
MTDKAFFSIDPSRSVVAVEGEDRANYQQGLISNDTKRVSAERAVYSAFLTPQGKFLHDFTLIEQSGVEGGGVERYLLDPETARAADLVKRLSMYRLRSKVKVLDLGADWSVVLFFGADALAKLGLAAKAGFAKPFGDGVAFVDPRLPDLGARAFLPKDQASALAAGAGFTAALLQDYDRLRIRLGVPLGSRDLTPEKAILLENGFEELAAIDWEKGCYMGQELTARTRYRGLVRKRLLPVEVSGPLPAAGTPLMLGDVEAGEMRSGAAQGDFGLAMIRLEHLERAKAAGLTAGDSRLRPFVPEWMRLPEQVG